MSELAIQQFGGVARRARYAPGRSCAGSATVMAMLFLVLFATLSLGFFAQYTTFSQIAASGTRAMRSQTAAETGLTFARYHMAGLNGGNGTSAQVLANIAAQLAGRLDGTGNLSGHPVEQATDSAGQPVVYLPGRSGTQFNWIDLGGAGATRLELRMNGSILVARSIGKPLIDSDSAITRIVETDYTAARAAWVSPGAGVLTRSPVVLSNGALVQGGDITVATAQSTPSLDISGGARIDGNVYYGPGAVAPRATNGARINGSSIRLPANPTFPEVDASVFAQFVPPATAPRGVKVLDRNSSISSNAVLTNIRIKANANLYFGNAVQLNGVIYIESPNRIGFGGGGRINGIIVTDSNPGVPLASNQITIDNGIRFEGVETLNPSAFPLSERISDLKALKGALILAPNYKVVLAGGSRSYNGSMVASDWDISNGYRGTITGNIVNLADTNFKMVGGGQLGFSNSSDPVSGLYSGSTFAPLPGSYREVLP